MASSGFVGMWVGGWSILGLIVAVQSAEGLQGVGYLDKPECPPKGFGFWASMDGGGSGCCPTQAECLLLG